jgi:uncharacterized Zn-finger protein
MLVQISRQAEINAAQQMAWQLSPQSCTLVSPKELQTFQTSNAGVSNGAEVPEVMAVVVASDAPVAPVSLNASETSTAAASLLAQPRRTAVLPAAAHSTMLAHHPVSPQKSEHMCTECGKTFTQSGNLSRHMNIHTLAKTYNCSMCDKAFTQRSHLKTHMNIHTGVKPFQCTICDKRFTQLGHMKGHMLNHPGYQQCNICNARFKLHEELILHRDAEHPPHEV